MKLVTKFFAICFTISLNFLLCHETLCDLIALQNVFFRFFHETSGIQSLQFLCFTVLVSLFCKMNINRIVKNFKCGTPLCPKGQLAIAQADIPASHGLALVLGTPSPHHLHPAATTQEQ
jgi:hypothetical protein